MMDDLTREILGETIGALRELILACEHEPHQRLTDAVRDARRALERADTYHFLAGDQWTPEQIAKMRAKS